MVITEANNKVLLRSTYHNKYFKVSMKSGYEIIDLETSFLIIDSQSV